MITIGLVGGVASGKSRVADDFKSLGACLLSGDQLGHEALRLAHVRDALVAKWGTAVLDDSGNGLNRGAIARIVFSEDKQAADAALKFLESVTHPVIRTELESQLASLRAAGSCPVAVLDAAVMIKAGWDKLCDKIVYVHAPLQVRLQRAKSRGMTEAQFLAREAAQTPLETKKSLADFVIDNGGAAAETFAQVQQVWHSAVEIA